MAGFSAVTSACGHDQANRSIAPVLASRSSPPRRENADRVVRGPAGGRGGLNRGQRACLAKNAVNAWCWCRSACWSGTDDTPGKNARPGSFFIAVSARSVSA